MYRLKYTKEFERDLKRLSAAEQKQTANKKALNAKSFLSVASYKKGTGT